VTVKIYAEGGGPGQLYDSLFRAAWKQFFQAAGLAGRLPRVIRGEGRSQTFDLFVTAVRNPRPAEVALLLVDSEQAVAQGNTPWQHLKSRDNWDKPPQAGPDDAFLMVQVMETWFLTDRQMLRNYFGAALREQHLPEWPTPEAVAKQTVFDALHHATAGCSKSYSKGKVSFDLLSRVSPGLVQAACPHALTLLNRLRQI
jgi:hypothetical protein